MKWYSPRTNVGLYMILLASLAVIVALLPTPANSQSDPPELREGIWVGDAIAFGTLWGTAEGGSALYVGAFDARVTLAVDADGMITGDWILGGEAVMEIDVPEPILITQVYDGSGTFTDRQNVAGVMWREIDMVGDVSTSGTANTSIGSIAVGPFVDTFQSSVVMNGADCYEAVGNWIPQLRRLASDAGWQESDIQGSFQVSFVGDEADHAITREIDELWLDIKAWAEAMVTSGVVDVGSAFTLLARSRVISLALAGAQDCIRSTVGRYGAQFVGGMAFGMARALVGRDFTASALLDMVTTAGALGDIQARNTIGPGIQLQTQRIIDENLDESAGCDLCFRAGSEEEVFNAALAGKLLGQEFLIYGETISAEEVMESVTGG